MQFFVPRGVEKLVASRLASGRHPSGDQVLRSPMRALADAESVAESEKRLGASQSDAIARDQ